jgi:hypothetical protein
MRLASHKATKVKEAEPLHGTIRTCGASVIGAFVFLNSATGSWPARYVKPIKEPVFCRNLKTVNLRITADTVVTFGSQFK